MSEFKFIKEPIDETNNAYKEAVKKLEELENLLNTNQELLKNDEWKGEANQQCILINSTLITYNNLLKEAIEEMRGIIRKLNSERRAFDNKKKREVQNIV